MFRSNNCVGWCKHYFIRILKLGVFLTTITANKMELKKELQYTIFKIEGQDFIFNWDHARYGQIQQANQVNINVISMLRLLQPYREFRFRV